MKKKLLCFTLITICVFSMNAQEFKVGINAGLPVSVSNEYAAALDVSYLFNVSNKLDIGLTTGLSYWFKRPAFNSGGLKVLETKEISVLPIALASRFKVHRKITLGVDLGYAVPIKSPMYESGLYFAPKIYYRISKPIDIVFGYRVAKLDYDLMTTNTDMLTLGIEFKL